MCDKHIIYYSRIGNLIKVKEILSQNKIYEHISQCSTQCSLNINQYHKLQSLPRVWETSPPHNAQQSNNLSVQNFVYINSRNKCGNTALIYASRHGYYEIVKELLKYKANYNIQGEDGTTALMWASRHSRIDIVKLLLEYDQDYYLTDNYNMTALKWACEKKCTRCKISPSNDIKNKKIINILKQYEYDQIYKILYIYIPVQYIYKDIIELLMKFLF